MSYELWRKLEEEEDSETKGRRPEIGHIFLLDRGKVGQPSPHLIPSRLLNVDGVVAKLVSSAPGCELV